MKTLIKLLGLILIDFILIWYFVYELDPDPSSSLLIVIYVPLAIFINLIICVILAIRKKNNINIFFLNSIISGIMMFYIFDAGIDRRQNRLYEGWIFQIQDTTFRITHSKEDESFGIDYITNPGTSSSYLFGKSEKRGSDLILLTDSIELTISSNYLYGFRNQNSAIKLVEVTR